jgi:hypothetical protein
LNNKYIKITAIILPILLAAICLISVIRKNNQAFMPVPLNLTFTGEFSYDRENWYPCNEDSDISALDGDLAIRGHFDVDIDEGAILNYYCNHIGVSMYVNGELVYMDTPTEIKNYGIDLMPSMCGKHWEQIQCPTISVEDEVEFRFINYHKYGNKEAYREFLSTCMLAPLDQTVLETYLKPYINLFEIIGTALLVVGSMLLGASLYAAILKSSMVNRLFKIGIMTLFVGGYTLLDVMMVYFTNELLVVRTYGGQLCMMLGVYFGGIIICDSLEKKSKKVAEIIMLISGLLNIVLIVVAISGSVLLYDTKIIWQCAQLIISLILIILCLLAMKKEKNNSAEMIAYIFIHTAIILDFIGVGYHMYYSDTCFKTSYLIMLLIIFFRGARQVVLDHQASIKNKKIKAELENSRITVMLSQIQPHFLYNSLTSVMYLCDSNPKQAKAAIADFADYLRGNLSALKTESLISFDTELKHIEKYLRLEKLRFMDELEIVYDIQSKDFMLPALSVQPLIENAVKHGVGKKTGGGTVTIHTTENENEYVICVTDDGVGFKEGEYVDDGGTHVGIENIKKRLEMMINAKLVIESKIGEGTKARILIPKRRD